MSTEKTADMFRNKSEEEIMNWMIKNMSPEQIKSCFEGDLPDAQPSVPPDVPMPKKSPDETLLELRRFCSNKRYVIHKIEGDRVWFWYYEAGKWNYYNKPFEHFKEIDGVIRECGEDTKVDDDIKLGLIDAYNKNLLDPSDRFNTSNPDEEQGEIFTQIKQNYKRDNINEDWKDVLLTALQIQKGVKVTTKEQELFNFAPVLIESVLGKKVNYYYLVNNDGDCKFVEGNISIDKFRTDIIEIIDDLKFDILTPSEDRRQGSRRPKEWISEIKQAANEIYEADLERIKKIYANFPLSTSSTYFMKDLFEDNEFGNNFGTSINLNTVNLSEYVKMKFGTNTARMFDAKIISNKFGTQTITLVKK